MHTTRVTHRLSTGVAALALAGGICVLQPTSAQAAPGPEYWTFRNIYLNGNQCLTGGKINGGKTSVFMSKCNGSNFQQWDWRGDDPGGLSMKQLQNKATGLCLATDNKSWENNAVWTSRCEWRDGMRFHYDDDQKYIMSALTSYNVFLTARESGAVYSTSDNDAAGHSWFGSH
ncbi:Ricin-type beta-trefoil lectin domain protein [Streptomyces sp. YIM 121038]|uniref:RICIN domain-containing protein n=1 Tax=Streptomyces sp. YIM 121038 TaxID=2136401 RepID=UPI0011100987|nr:ricin-type beta-trefoil lectin domain protein [Streptomyces sp. YIM 121038]QCX81707.1 Ricin-type beta-trefoil lectin domain protein [Streptomyces sp. YIM 121038]